MKPEYMQSKIEELIREKESLTKKVNETDSYVKSLEATLKSLENETEGLKRRLSEVSVPPKAELSAEEYEKLCQVIKNDLEKHKTALDKEMETLIEKEFDEAYKKLNKKCNALLKAENENCRIQTNAYNNICSAIQKLLHHVDPRQTLKLDMPSIRVQLVDANTILSL